MKIQEIEAQIKSEVWKAIAQSELDFSAVPHPTVEELIALVSRTVLLEVDRELGRIDTDVQKNSGLFSNNLEEESADDEQLIWEGRPFLSLTTHYRLTNQRIRITEGLFNKQRIDLELVKIQDVSQTQNVGERMFNIGDLTIRSHDATNPIILLNNISDVQRVHELLRHAILASRKKVRFTYHEEM